MIISILNHTNGEIADSKVQEAIRAINRQLQEDFYPYWGIGAQLRLEGRSTTSPGVESIADMRGDAVLYLWNGSDIPDALGYHDRTNGGIPFGFVFTKLSEELGENWTVTLSHEALELVADPEVNLLVQGPHPDPARNNDLVFHWYEMCDAVQGDTYEIDGVEVSNFVLPLYFTSGDEFVGRNDFLGSVHENKTLRSFSVNPGGYIGFFDPETGDDQTYSMRGDALAAKRLRIKAAYKSGRRMMRQEVIKTLKFSAYEGRQRMGSSK
jgi:hypothetical protein